MRAGLDLVMALTAAMRNIVERLRAGEPCKEARDDGHCRVMTAQSGCICAEAADRIEQLEAALEEASDLAIALCAGCRQNINDKQFLNWAHDDVGVAIINIRNRALEGKK